MLRQTSPLRVVRSRDCADEGPCRVETGAPLNGGTEVVLDASTPSAAQLAQAQEELTRLTRAVQRSASLFRSIVDNVTDLLAVLDADGGIRYLSRSATTVLGYEPRERLGRTHFELVHPDDLERVRRVWGSLTSGKSTKRLTCRCRHKDGSWRYLESTGANLLADSIVRGIVITARDVTERTEAEVRLRAQDREMRAIVEAVNDIVFEFDGEGRYLGVWAADETKLIHPKNELLGRRVADVLGHDAAMPFLVCIRRVLRTGVAETLEYALTLENGEHRFDARFRRLPNFGGQPDTVRMIIADVTERKCAEEQLRRSEAGYRSLIEHAPVGIYRTTPDDRFMAVNPALVAMLGYRNPEELIGRPITTVFCADLKERDELLSRLRTSGGSVVETEWKKKDGKLVTVRITVRVVHDSGAGTDCFEGLVEDVTDHRLLERQLRVAHRLESVGLLAGGVAHDFNNLLGVIGAGADIAEAQIEQHMDAIRDELHVITSAVQRGGALTKQLLAFARRQPITPRAFLPSEAIGQLLDLLKRLLGVGVSIETDFASTARVEMDPTQFEQVIVNLSVNARDAMPDGGRLTFGTANIDLDEVGCRDCAGARPGQYLMLSVSDTGAGMSEETKARLFEPFFTTKQSDRGTGLGLATVHGIVAQNGGHICVHSEPGRGATFRIYLPRVDEPVGATPLAEQGNQVLKAPDGQTACTDDAVVRHDILEEGTAFLQQPCAPEILVRKVREILDRSASKAT